MVGCATAKPWVDAKKSDGPIAKGCSTPHARFSASLCCMNALQSLAAKQSMDLTAQLAAAWAHVQPWAKQARLASVGSGVQRVPMSWTAWTATAAAAGLPVFDYLDVTHYIASIALGRCQILSLWP